MKIYRIAALPQIDIEKVPKSARGGDCYEASGHYMMDNGRTNSNIRLAHGNVIGQGKIRGIKYDHAWIEDGDLVIDKSLGRDIQLPKQLYYSLGNVSDVTLYDMQQFIERINKYKHWGPWE